MDITYFKHVKHNDYAQLSTLAILSMIILSMLTLHGMTQNMLLNGD